MRGGFLSALGRAIKIRRAEREIGRRDLADEAGISYSYLAEIESGAKSPSTESLERIADALGWSTSELIAEAELRTQLRSPQAPLKERSEMPVGMAASLVSRSRGEAPPEDLLEELRRLIRRMSPEDQRALLEIAKRLAR